MWQHRKSRLPPECSNLSAQLVTKQAEKSEKKQTGTRFPPNRTKVRRVSFAASFERFNCTWGVLVGKIFAVKRSLNHGFSLKFNQHNRTALQESSSLSSITWTHFSGIFFISTSKLPSRNYARNLPQSPGSVQEGCEQRAKPRIAAMELKHLFKEKVSTF